MVFVLLYHYAANPWFAIATVMTGAWAENEPGSTVIRVSVSG
jgi:hypothetical protein